MYFTYWIPFSANKNLYTLYVFLLGKIVGSYINT